MKFLLDACVSRSAFDELRASGFDVEWVGSWKDVFGDEEVLSRAFTANGILVTLDKDFGELAIVRRSVHAGIIRLVSQRSDEQAALVKAVVEK
ncbi:MAG TPA: toxin-antitoxin system, toxin component, PIN family protein [Phycisphaerales bacterium]|nr:toxin-antitoxin system, toxin component, PIN family protein [Phycisphaerales bacterium]